MKQSLDQWRHGYRVHSPRFRENRHGMVIPDYVRLSAPNHPSADRAGHVLEHRVVAEKAFGGQIPTRHPIHHVDCDRSNNANSNLVICEDKKYHYLLHTRTRILKAGGNPDTDKICSCCHKVKPIDEFSRQNSSPDGRCTACKSCHLKQRKGRR